MSSKQSISSVMPKKDLKKFIKKYNKWLGTADGKKCFDDAVVLREQGKNPVLKTDGVNQHTLQAVKELFAPISSCPPVLIKIVPKCLNNMCFKNADLIMEHTKYKRRSGYNITSCDCGKFVSMEIHSLNEVKKDKFFDLTRDFGGEKYKWFCPIADFDGKYIDIVNCKKQMGGVARDLDYIAFDVGCNCGRGQYAKEMMKVQMSHMGLSIKSIDEVRECVEEWKTARYIKKIEMGGGFCAYHFP